MGQSMLGYIKEQPGLWQQMLQDGVEYEGDAPLRISLVGSGSSYHACRSAERFYRTVLHLPSAVTTPTTLGVTLPYIPPEGTLAVVVSQSGRSTNSVQAVRDLKGRGVRTLALTANPASPVAQAADGHILLPCGAETTPAKTKGATASVLALYLLGLRFVGEERRREVLDGLQRAIAAFPANLEAATAFIERHMEAFTTATSLTIAADMLPAAEEGALKALETLYIPAFAYEFEEYLHGVHNTLGGARPLVLVASCGESLARMQRLAAFARREGSPCFVVTAQAAPADAFTLQLGGAGLDWTAPFETLLFFQLLAALGSEAKGIDCEKPRWPDFYAALGTKA